MEQLGYQEDSEIDEILLIQNFLRFNSHQLFLLEIQLKVSEYLWKVKDRSTGFTLGFSKVLDELFTDEELVLTISKTFDQFKEANKKLFKLKPEGFFSRLLKK